METVIREYAQICQILDDPRFGVAEAPAAGTDAGGLAWLRANVSRFTEGAAHARRRDLAVAELQKLDTVRLRHDARTLAAALLAQGATVEHIARTVPVTVLGTALGIDGLAPPRDETAPWDPAVIADAYLTPPSPGTPARAAADAAVTRLSDAAGSGDGGGAEAEEAALRIGLLAQAHAATAGLIMAALARLEGGQPPTEAVLAETLRLDPPVKVMRRVVRAEDSELGGSGTTVLLEVAAANRDPAVFSDPDRFDPSRYLSGGGGPPHLTFGAGRRPCPGIEQALALAAGVLEEVAGR